MEASVLLRKFAVYSETVLGEAGREAAVPIHRVAAAGLIDNPVSGRFAADLSEFFELGMKLGERLTAAALEALPGPAVSYGKAAVVGVGGDLEHGHAMLHPMLGKAMRGPVGGGSALIPSAAKVAAAGSSIDIPLGHKDDAWSFDHFDCISITVPDGPRPDEIMLVVAFADGGRPNARVGEGRIVQ